MMYSETRRKYSWMWLILGATAALGCESATGPTGAVELDMSAFRPVADSVISLPGLDDLREGDILAAELVLRNIGEDILVVSEYVASLIHLLDADGQSVPNLFPSISDRVVFDPPLDAPSGESTEIFWTSTVTPLLAQNPGLYSLSFIFVRTGSGASTTIEITAP